LIVKLPRARVDELVSKRAGRRYEPAPGRVMKEWLAVGPDRQSDWLRLACEALDFAARAKRVEEGS